MVVLVLVVTKGDTEADKTKAVAHLIVAHRSPLYEPRQIIMERCGVHCSRLLYFPDPSCPQTLRFVRIHGLGEKGFMLAMALLCCLQQGDGKVTSDGVQYDGKKRKQASLWSVRGGSRASEGLGGVRLVAGRENCLGCCGSPQREKKRHEHGEVCARRCRTTRAKALHVAPLQPSSIFAPVGSREC